MFLVVIQIDLSRVWLTLVAKILVGSFIIGAGALYREREIVEQLKYKLNWQNSRGGRREASNRDDRERLNIEHPTSTNILGKY
jgi:hypothetical protein